MSNERGCTSPIGFHDLCVGNVKLSVAMETAIPCSVYHSLRSSCVSMGLGPLLPAGCWYAEGIGMKL